MRPTGGAQRSLKRGCGSKEGGVGFCQEEQRRKQIDSAEEVANTGETAAGCWVVS